MGAALEELRRLDQALEALRRTSRYRFLGLVACNGLLAVGVFAIALRPPASVPPVLSAYGFELLDTEGKTRATFATNREGQPELAMVGNEKTRITLGFSRAVKDFPLLSFGDDKKDSFVLASTPTGPELHLKKTGNDADPAAHTVLRGGSLYLQSDPNGAFFQCGVFGKDRFKTSSCYLELYDGEGNEQFCATPMIHPRNR